MDHEFGQDDYMENWQLYLKNQQEKEKEKAFLLVYSSQKESVQPFSPPVILGIISDPKETRFPVWEAPCGVSCVRKEAKGEGG